MLFFYLLTFKLIFYSLSFVYQLLINFLLFIFHLKYYFTNYFYLLQLNFILLNNSEYFIHLFIVSKKVFSLSQYVKIIMDKNL